MKIKQLLAIICVGAMASWLTSCGDSSLTCGAGTEQIGSECLGLAGDSGAEEEENVYVSDFDVSGLGFTRVWIPSSTDVSEPADFWFTVQNAGDTTRDAVYIKMGLEKVEGTVDELDLEDENFAVDYPVWGGVVEDLQPCVGDCSEQKQKVEYTITTPAELEAGLYAVIYTIDEHRVALGEDGEVVPSLESDYNLSENSFHQSRSVMVATDTLLVGKADLPNLRIISAETGNASLIVHPEKPITDVSVLVDSMVLDTVDPVNLHFALELPGHVVSAEGEVTYDESRTFALAVGEYGEAHVTFEQECEMVDVFEEPEGLDDGTENPDADAGGDETDAEYETEIVDAAVSQVEECKALRAERSINHDLGLYLSADDLALLQSTLANAAVYPNGTDEIAGTLVVTLDPEGAQDEWNDNQADNVKRISVVLMPTEPPSDPEEMEEPAEGDLEDQTHSAVGPYHYNLYNPWGYYSSSGGWWAAHTIDISTQMNFDWWSGGLRAVYTKHKAYVFGRLAGWGFTPIDALLELDGNIQAPQNFKFNTHLKVMGHTYFQRNYGNYCSQLQGTTTSSCTLWSGSKVMSRRPSASATFWVFFIPVRVTAGANFELGIKGKVDLELDFISTQKKVGLVPSAEPFAKAEAFAEGGVSFFGFGGGVGIALTLIRVGLPVTAGAYLYYNSANNCFGSGLRFNMRVTFNTLDGRFYAFGTWWELQCRCRSWWCRCWWNHRRIEKNIGSWRGLDWGHTFVNYNWGSNAWGCF